MGHRSAIEIEDMSRDDYDKAMRQVWAPTLNMRYIKRIPTRKFGLNDLVLQQMWIDQFGSKEWRDVPLVDTEAK